MNKLVVIMTSQEVPPELTARFEQHNHTTVRQINPLSWNEYLDVLERAALIILWASTDDAGQWRRDHPELAEWLDHHLDMHPQRRIRYLDGKPYRADFTRSDAYQLAAS